MSDADDRLMAATMEWLRALLSPTEGVVAARRRFREAPPVPVDPRAPVRRARAALEQAMAADPAPRFVAMSDALGLRPFERDVALLCLAHAVSADVTSDDDGDRDRTPARAGVVPTFALAMELAEDVDHDALPPDRRTRTTRVAAVPDWAALAPDRPLRRWRLLEIAQPAGRALVSSALRLDERIVNHVKGHDHLDERLVPYLDDVPDDEPDDEQLVSGSQQALLAAALGQLQRVAPHRSRLLVQMPGGDAPTKRLFASALAGAWGLRLHRLTLDHLPAAPGDLAALMDLWNREQHLQDVALLVDALDAGPSPTLGRLLAGVTGLVLLDVREPVQDPGTTLVLDVARPEPAEQRAMWDDVLPGAAGDDVGWPERLAAQFDLNPRELAAVAATAGPEDDAGAAAWDVCRLRARARLEGLAQRITTGTTLDDVELPEHEKRLLEQVRDQTRHRARVYDEYGFRTRLTRGLGITALLAGESGTGKTMAAEALANELRLDLYRIDLAGVVSKYIGETEKNLQRVFDAAQQSGAVLLFDEADAIFGKRSEVQDSHDRYANIEVSYLLQRMEAYEGLAVLTTNMKTALDPAFVRRLRFIVTFPFPGPAERERIWRRVFPVADPAAPEPQYLLPGADRLDMAALGRPSLTGGQIRNIAVNGAFLAAARTGEVTMRILAEAAREELRKSNRPYVAADFAAWEQGTPAQPVGAGAGGWSP